jgi:hypothetical protein
MKQGVAIKIKRKNKQKKTKEAQCFTMYQE